MHSAQTLDAKIGALTAAVGDLQGEVQAALATLRDGQHAHPYYWAPFVLVGGW